jgi:hypothetical protein
VSFFDDITVTFAGSKPTFLQEEKKPWRPKQFKGRVGGKNYLNVSSIWTWKHLCCWVQFQFTVGVKHHLYMPNIKRFYFLNLQCQTFTLCADAWLNDSVKNIRLYVPVFYLVLNSTLFRRIESGKIEILWLISWP